MKSPSMIEDIHRGLSNPLGANNCFLNSALQTLWHLPRFRRALAAVPPEISSGKGALLLPALHTLFANFQYGDDTVLPADEVRAVLSSLFASSGHFQIGQIDDAVECLEAILKIIHCEFVGVPLDGGGDELSCNPTCPACASFKVSFMDRKACTRCPATSDPKMHNDFTSFTWHVWSPFQVGVQQNFDV